jgi:hypothetical protein
MDECAMGGNHKKKSVSCWEYFNCPKHFREKCPVYLDYTFNQPYCEGWFLFNPLEGGPAKRGPCYKCEMLKSVCPEMEMISKNTE